ncbi:MAG TPA: 3-deoxy-D-manno-octulosonic acid transferase [Burkholderiaceae bacterium]|nr:3-deoxy-D-manno-octulosonic acid transferase [Burkholderiaceae bacterium]
MSARGRTSSARATSAPRAWARGAYSLLLGLLKPAYLAKLWWRGRHEPLYRHAVLERLGHYPGPASTGWVWVHAVSLGETRAAGSLVEALRAELPGMRLLLTHGTATGREAGQALLRAGDEQVWLPYDTPGVVRRFFEQFRPAVGVLMETEIWPNLLHAAQAAGVPMVVANARLSEKSLRQAQRLEPVMRPAAATLALVLAQTPADAERLRRAGAGKVEVCGNLKFDMTPDESLLARGRHWREAAGRPVVLAASTREGEEAPLLQAWAGLTEPRPLLWIVPRHPQRFDEVAALVQAQGWRQARRSAWGDAGPREADRQADIWLGDSIGEMPAYYAAADVALLGGSFAPLGGQNLIEAAACGCPVVMGPHTFNFAEAAELALEAGAAWRVADFVQGVARATRVVGGPEAKEAAERALRFAAAHRGAAQTMASRIAALVPPGGGG